MKGARGEFIPALSNSTPSRGARQGVPHSNLPLWAESVFVKARHRGLSGSVVDRQNIKSARAIADMAFREKPLRRSNEDVLLVSRNAQFGQSGVLFALGPRSDFDKCACRAVVTHQVNLALGSARHVISCHKNISMPSQVPVGVSFAAHTRSPGHVLLGIGGGAFFFTQASPRRPMNRLKHEPRENRHRPAAGTTILFVRSIDKNPVAAMFLI